MKPYIFSAKADADMLNIALYTRRQWGIVQMRRYVLALERGIINLAEGTGYFKTISSPAGVMRIAHIEHHYIILKMRSDAPALVIAILYERRDIAAQLADRIKE